VGKAKIMVASLVSSQALKKKQLTQDFPSTKEAWS